ncbi:MAG TPA: CcmD family protein [Polyangiales bacterium]|nr:CcmD family protein [Polyangiales bacterium]
MSRRVASWVLVAGFCGLSALTSTGVLAQDDNQEDRAASFQAVSGGTKEDVPGGPLLVVGYAAVWIAVFGYVFRINRLQRGVEGNLERLERSIERQGTST